MINKKKLALGLGVLLALAIGSQMDTSMDSSSIDREQSTSGPVLPKEEYEKSKVELINLVNDQDPTIALAEFRKRIATDNALMRSCHALVHEIGHAAYEKYGDFGESLNYQDEICNSGYLHGIIERHFLNSADVLAEMKTVCIRYPLGKFLSWQCNHGLGHGAMYYTSNDLPKSLKLCDSLASAFARSTCANGVFMENFNTDQKLHPSQFLNEHDPFYPCVAQEERHKNDCYLYAPTYYLRLHKNDYDGALRWCEGTEPLYESPCVQGVGSQAMKENVNNPTFAEKICLRNKPEHTDPCIDGMVRLYINHHGSLEPAKSLCEQLALSHRQTCRRSVQASSELFM